MNRNLLPFYINVLTVFVRFGLQFVNLDADLTAISMSVLCIYMNLFKMGRNHLVSYVKIMLIYKSSQPQSGLVLWRLARRNTGIYCSA